MTRANRGAEWLTDNCQRPQRLPHGAHVTRLGPQNSLEGLPLSPGVGARLQKGRSELLL